MRLGARDGVRRFGPVGYLRYRAAYRRFRREPGPHEIPASFSDGRRDAAPVVAAAMDCGGFAFRSGDVIRGKDR